jgi:hypothetical protein
MFLHVVGGLEGLAALRAGGRLLHGVLHPKRTTVAASSLSIIVADPDRRCGSGSDPQRLFGIRIIYGTGYLSSFWIKNDNPPF